jgi:hypothetical protein
VITTLDVTVPVQLTMALIPDLVLMGGAMVLLLWASLRPDSQEHQRDIGIASIILCGITAILVLTWSGRYAAGPGPIATSSSPGVVRGLTAQMSAAPTSGIARRAGSTQCW